MTAILVTGATGQVGHALAALMWPADVILHTPGRDVLDLTRPGSIADWFAGNPVDAIVNCAADTAVDRAEDAVADAFAANALGPALLADQARTRGLPLIQVSTDYVFDGSATQPYREDAPVAPLGTYGASKLAGEQAVLHGAPRSTVLRTAWVFGAHRGNFLKTMLRAARTRDEIAVVDDQRGCPTAAVDIAAAIRTIVLRQLADPAAPSGIYHFTNAGAATWHDFAAAIFARSAARGGPHPRLLRVTTAQFPTRARRPAYSRLSTARLEHDYGIVPRPWQDALEAVMADLPPGATGS